MKANPIAASGKRCTALGALILLFLVQTARAVILLGSGDPGYNTTPPDGALAGSGWQYQGTWGSFLGTPIAPQYFIAAHHVGGSIGQTLTFRGVPYKTTAFWDDPESDLRIWKVDGIFPDYAPLYPASDEAGKLMVVFGRGTQRGEEVLGPELQTIYTTNTVNLKALGISKKAARAEFPNATFHGNKMTVVVASVIAAVRTTYQTNFVDLKSLGITKKLAQKQFPHATFFGDRMAVVTASVTTNYVTKGWKTGMSDGVMRWGQSVMTGVGALLTGAFDQNGGPNQAYLSSGDSSGAVFAQQNGVWMLAGLNYAVDGPFGVTDSDSFYGAIFDIRGLYVNGVYQPADGEPTPAAFYATRISSRLAWIQSVIAN